MKIVVSDHFLPRRTKRRTSAYQFARNLATDHDQYGVASAVGDYIVVEHLYALTGIRWPINQAIVTSRMDRVYVVYKTAKGFEYYICEE